VPSDPRKLKPSELCRLLNSTPIGEVLSDRQLHRHRMRAGNRIGDGKHVDLLRYIAWLVQEKHAPRKETDGDPYERMKENARARNAAMALAGRDIGELPAIADPDRKARAKTDFRFFCEAYFPQTFHLPWSPDHLKVIGRIEQAVLRGGLFSMAMPRGSGKTSVCECACIWAVLNGHREFVCLIGSNEGHACDMLESIKTELDGNDLLLADYPEVVFPIQALDGIANRCNGQLYKGERTHIGWTAKEVVLPTIEGSPASGAIIKVAGITGRIRGMKYKRSDGKTARPTLVVIDDPQTDESARSLSQCATRESILAGAILGLAGPGKKISGIMPCTVIRPGDMADNILSRDRHPEWNGERTKMVYSFPSNEKLWQRYSEIRAESLRNQGDIELATAFYTDNRDEMDLGAVVAWPERFNYDERSAIQHAMNLKLQDEAAEILGDYKGSLDLSGLEYISNLAAERLSKYRGDLKALISYGKFTGEMYLDGKFITTLARYQVFLHSLARIQRNVIDHSTIEFYVNDVMRVASLDQQLISKLEKRFGRIICGENLFYLAVEDSFRNLETRGQTLEPPDPQRSDPFATIVNSIGQKLVPIKEGKFIMGSPEEEEGNDDETQHQVVLSDAFYMSMTLVTQKQFEHVMGYNPSYFQGPTDTSAYPVEGVSWHDAVEFCKKLSEFPEEKAAGRYYRLPTEAEWEYCCRAGTTSAFSFCDGENLLDYAWFWGNARTNPVGSMKPNPWGLYDMYGNVIEWCSDWYGEYSKARQTDPKGPEEGTDRVIRGGCFDDDGECCRSAWRSAVLPETRANTIGFRVVMNLNVTP
jgi:formylglycine-generating enzyme required for sulfatase activity